MLQGLRDPVQRSCRRVAAAMEKALGYVLDYGLPALLLTCLAVGLVLLAQAYWVVD
jgi:hypothetical protein